MLFVLQRSLWSLCLIKCWGHGLARRDEKGKMKKEKGEGEKAAGASIRPDKSGLLGNRLFPAMPQTAKLKSPPLRGGYGG
jgi:hypothetical protein